MVNLIIFFIIFIIIVYLVFQLFVQLFKSFHLIDTFFVNKINNVEDFFVQKLIDSEDISIDTNNKILNELKNKKRKTLNMYLRFDFLLSLTLGIFWFIFPIFVLDTKSLTKGKYLGKYLGLFTVISGFLPLFNIKDKEILEKKKILVTKFIISWIVIITFFIHVYYLNRINPYAIFSLFLTTLWMANSFLGIYDGFDLHKKF